MHISFDFCINNASPRINENIRSKTHVAFMRTEQKFLYEAD